MGRDRRAFTLHPCGDHRRASPRAAAEERNIDETALPHIVPPFRVNRPHSFAGTLAVVYASSSPAERGPLCPPFDSEQWQRDRLRPAGKRLAGLNVGEPRTVRLIYFLPKDRTPQQDIDAKMDELIKNVQLSYEEMMEYHGFGARTFALETDATGKAVVHHVKGKFNDEYYLTDTGRKVIDEETAEQFDLSANVYLVVLDVSNAVIDGACGIGASWGPEAGMALIPAPNSARQRERGWSCFNVDVTAHEVGHAFGLVHDHFRNATRSPSSYHTDFMVTSFCAAEWLDAHRYFNRGQTYPQKDERTTIQMFPPLAVPPNAIRLRFEVTDPDGLHQAQLHNRTGDAIDCQGINGESVSVEFVTPEATERVSLRVVDVYGNVTEQWQPIDITALLPPEVISIPDANLAAVVREALDLAPGDAISQLDMLRLGGLEANGRQITDLTGLEYAVNLKELRLGDNQISDIRPLEESTILEWLELYNNNISDISSLAAMTHLTFLHLYDNSVSDLSPLTESINLHELTLGDNSVSDLSPLAGLIHLVRLELYNNNISDISSLAAMTHLTFLHLGDNSVSDLSPLERLTKLKELDLWYNSVSDLSPLAELNGLTFLQIDGNLVSDLSPLVANTGLGDGDVVYVQNNPLSYASIHTHIPILLERGVTVNHDNRAHSALLKISGYNQQGASGVPLAQPFVVAVQDENGSALEGVQVTFTVTEGGGTLSAATDTTDANGQAATTLTLGSEPGTNTVEATVAGFKPVTFTAVGQAIPHSLTKISGDDQEGAAGTQLAEPFVVAVLDEDDEVIAGAVVTFSVTAGGGTLSVATATTDANGQAVTRLTLGSDPGTNTVSATVEGLESVTFTATGQESPLASLLDLFGGGKRVALPDSPQLAQNAPNPFNSQTVFAYFLPAPGPAHVEVFALNGQRVAVLQQGPQQAGYHRLRWNGRDDAGRPVASGAYLYRLVTGETVLTRKLTLLR